MDRAVRYARLVDDPEVDVVYIGLALRMDDQGTLCKQTRHLRQAVSNNFDETCRMLALAAEKTWSFLKHGSRSMGRPAQQAQLTFANTIPVTIIADHALEGWGPLGLLPQWVKITLKAEYMELSLAFSTITVIPKQGKRRVEKCYKRQGDRGEEWCSAYRYQLEAFVDKVRCRSPMAWRSAEDSIDAMHAIDAVYTKICEIGVS
ncbi:hypothetical protein WOLCODRAFT_20303 [Wolfiporia cocos MD-104 SS10]|uniref:Uncharacterized protein n=1 Tax=Wolfiporia cocos (strain MD-104) TaxID=742152 RepID=A0A2H3J1A9_WOLCO|nr:hypothetical protein WOLCODRAFT_20303 [Wolfiporia cocos MD-104 SS10]